MEELEDDFESIQRSVMEILEEKGIGIKKLKRTICSLPAHVQMNSFKSFERISANCDEIERIVSIWNRDVVWSFLDFALLGKIVKEYGTNEMKISMKQYSVKVADFRKRTLISRLMEIWTEPNKPSEYGECKTLILNLDVRADECTLERLEVLRNNSREKLLKGIPLSEAALVLFLLERGCISVTWIVPINLVQKIREALVQCIADGEYFKENSIISVELDGESFMPLERLSHRNKRPHENIISVCLYFSCRVYYWHLRMGMLKE